MSFVARLRWFVRRERASLHPRVLLARAVLAPVPAYVGNGLRTRVLRRAGFDVGPRTAFWGTPTLVGSGRIQDRLKIGADCWFNIGCFFELNDAVTVEDEVAFGHEVMVLTGTHHLGGEARRSGALKTAPIRVGRGAWIGARVTLLPGVEVGPGAVIAAGAVVTRSVPAHTLAGGVPAKVLRSLRDVPEVDAPTTGSRTRRDEASPGTAAG